MSNKEKRPILPEQMTFSRRVFKMSAIERSFYRVLSYSFFVVFLGLIVSFYISDVERLKWIAGILTLIFLDYLIHYRRAHYTISELFNGHSINNNVALCLDRETVSHLLSAFEKTKVFGGDIYLALLLSLMDKPHILKSLERLDININEFKNRLEQEYEATLKIKNQPISREELLSKIKNLVIMSAIIANYHSRREIDDEALFAGVASISDSNVARVFDLFSVSPDDIVSSISIAAFLFSKKFSIPKAIGGFALKMTRTKSHKVNRSLTSRPTPILDRFSRDVTDLAQRGFVGFLIGHDEEYDQMVDVLSRGAKRNVILVGEPGVGKNTLVEHLALDIISDNVPKSLFDKRLIDLSIGDLVSGASYEEISNRLSVVVEEIAKAGNIILCIPDIHNLTKTSAVGSLELSDMLMPIIKSDIFPVIGISYPHEYKEFVESKADFLNTFEIINVEEISEKDATTLISYMSILLEKEYKVSINFSAIKQAVLLCKKYLRQTKLPSSAEDLIKEALADATQKGETVLTGEKIISIVERKVNVPIHRAGQEEARALLHLEETIHQNYVDQEEAVTSVANALRTYRSGISRKGGPMAVFLFVGPTGVGKTELSKILAKIQFGSEKFMLRFDMSEYQEKSSLVRFIGSPDGKIAGALTEGVIHSPYSLILLDEFEKANSDILNLFLQVFDDGRLTDGFGRVVDFSNTIIIATSNAHSIYIQEQIGSGKNIDQFSEELKKKLTEYFKPELINRFSDVVVFRPLSLEDVGKVAVLSLKKLASVVFDAQGIILQFDDLAVKLIAQKGYDPMFGVRPLRKAIDNNITSILSNKILSQEVKRGQTFYVTTNGDQFMFEIK